MLSKNSVASQASPSRKAKAGRAKNPGLLHPRSKIDTPSGGSGTVNDPPGQDNKPPGYDDLELLA